MSEKVDNVSAKNNSKKPETGMAKLRFNLSKTPVRGPVLWWRHRGLRPDDVFFSTYPRSGTTWTRFTMYEVLTGEPATFESVNTLLMGIGRQDESRTLLPNGGRLIGTHEPFRKEYKRSIYLMRDVRDVILSEYAFMTALDRFHGSMDQFLETFFKGRVTGYGSWPKHVASWLDCPYYGTDRLLTIRYEDLRKDPEAGFTRMLNFVGIERAPEQVRRAVANNSVEQMRAKELQSPRKATVKGKFIGAGKVQGWRDKLSEAQLALIEYHAGDVMDRVGYPRSSTVTATKDKGKDKEHILAANRA
jgi:Sulfotransferase domain